MPFDSAPIIAEPRRLVALDASLLNFGAGPRSSEAVGPRPIPAWHASRDPGRIVGTITVLARARQLIADEQKWCRRTFARGWRGIPVPVKSSVAQSFCVLGAIMRAGREFALPVEDARNALEWQIARPIQDWNDDPARTHAEVISILDASIAALESCVV
jgi:hypothetical protein